MSNIPSSPLAPGPSPLPVGFCSSPRFVLHRNAPQHPERPDRIRAIHRAVRVAGMIDSPDPFPDFSINLGPLDGRGLKLLDLEPTPAIESQPEKEQCPPYSSAIESQPEKEQCPPYSSKRSSVPLISWVESVHTRQHVEFVRHVCEVGGGVLDQGDTRVVQESYEVALLAVGAVLRCCDAVMSGQVRRAFAAVRPPGHHAEPDRSMGFCLFSNVAIGARYLQRHHGLERIAIVDFDVHHGNGTQAAFEDDPSVLFVSLHQDPRTCYPGTGYADDTGVGAGAGYTINLPFPPGADDADYLAAFDDRVIPALDAYQPDAILISAGFDAHHADPLAHVQLSESCYEEMTRRIVEIAEHHSAGRVISALEGGYELRALGRSVVRHLHGLAGG
ncbi:MAG: histone deacetylase [Tepidisphaeraceae bacterium]